MFFKALILFFITIGHRCYCFHFTEDEIEVISDKETHAQSQVNNY